MKNPTFISIILFVYFSIIYVWIQLAPVTAFQTAQHIG